MRTEIEFSFEEARQFKNKSNEVFEFQAGELVRGELDITPDVGPRGTMEFAHPSWCKLEFVFNYNGQSYRHKSLFPARARFLFSDNQHVTEQRSNFYPNVGKFEELLDGRRDISYLVEGREKRTVRTKYMSTQYEVMVSHSTLTIRCRHYDLNFGDYREIYYDKPISSIMFVNATKIFYDKDGKIDDMDFCGEPFTIIERV